MSRYNQYGERMEDEDLEAIVKKGKKIAPWVGLGVAAALLFGMSYRPVDANSLGVVTQFGRYDRTVESGPQFILPIIEHLKQVDVTTNQSVEIGFRTVKPASHGEGAQYRDAVSGDEEMIREAQMLTADENIAWVSMVIQYKVNPLMVTDYLFNVKNPEDTIQLAGQAALRQVVGNYGVDEVITSGRTEITDMIKQETQKLLDLYGLGVDVQGVYLQSTQPPNTVGSDSSKGTVADAFRSVESARQSKESKINEALAYQNKITTEAQGEAQQIIAQAQGTKATRIGEAQRDVGEFNLLLPQYQLDPAGTRTRLYLEAMEQIYPNLNINVVDINLVDGGLLPLLNLNDGTGNDTGGK